MKKDNLGSKGFVITSDSFLGLTILFVLILASMFYISQVSFNSWNNIDLINSARDVLIVFDKASYFENAILQGSSEVLVEKINSTPKSLCFELSLIPKDSSIPLIIALKSGCFKNFNELIVVNRSIIVNDGASVSFFTARVEAWYK
ncbi:MAG: hypothetical protein PHX27_03325 [Candidatus ainarchaeum sp.]|nr:hypothetical protein [Candidatus ainarchaeum sp.]